MTDLRAISGRALVHTAATGPLPATLAVAVLAAPLLPGNLRSLVGAGRPAA